MWRRTSRGIQLALVLVMLLALLPLGSVSADATIVLVDPPSQSVDVGQTVAVNIKVDTVTNLYGVDIRLTFDAAKLQAQDQIGTMSGVQIKQGDFLDPAQGFMAENSVDNTTGEVRYVFALMAPAPAASGTGVLARIFFQATDSGTAVVSLTSVTLSDNQAQPIAATLMDGSITILPAAGPTATPTPTTPGVTPVPTDTPVPTVTPPAGVGFPYVVQWGDTVYSIARRFGVPPDAIVQANNLANPNFIRAGQVLIIPTLPPPPPGPITYVVQPGDNLFRISLKFKVPIEAIIAINRIINPWYIRAGQLLIIPTGVPPVPPPARSYVVQPGDTVWAIAAMYRVTPWAIIALNNLVNPNLIFVGQTLLIP
jgi:LysM repeat protein